MDVGSALERFRGTIGGELLLPTDAQYDEARTLFNAMIDRRPAAIVRCGGVSDIVRAVRFAKENELLVAIRAGGHSIAGNSMCDDGLVIDLSRMKGIRVNPARRTAWAQGGATWGDLDRETQEFGLATTGGVMSKTGIAGLTLGGGLGYLMRQHGLACDNLVRADIVTADGDFLHASQRENKDLFWGLRGGGGNFGVVTAFEFRLHPVGRILGGTMVWPFHRAKEVLEACTRLMSRAPRELGLQIGLTETPEVSPGVLLVACHNGPIEDGERLLRPIRRIGKPVLDDVRPMEYCELQTMFDTGRETRFHNYWRSSFLRQLNVEAIATVVDSVSRLPSRISSAWIEYLGGAIADVPPSGTAFSHRGAVADLLILARWRQGESAGPNIAWARKLWNDVQPFSTGGGYVNYFGHGDEDATKAIYGQTYKRLAALKEKYDPKNFFRMNQNIQPLGSSGLPRK